MRPTCRFRLSAALLAACLSAPAGALFALPAVDRFLPSMDDAEDAVPDITAASIHFDRESGWYTASGNVRIVYGNNELHAEEVRLDPESGEVRASGNVRLIRKDQSTWTGDNIAYNYKTGAGLASVLDVRSDPFTVHAEESSRQADGTFLLDRVQVTTCTNELGAFHYHVSGRETEFKPGGYFKARHAVLRLGRVPIFYVPYWYRDFEHHYGFRFVPGYSSRWGAYLLSAYTFKMVDFGKDDLGKDMSLNSKTHLDLRSKRGVAVGQDFSWALGGGGRGFLSGYLLDDDDPGTRCVSPYDELDPERYRVRAEHDLLFSPYDRIRLQATYLSDNDVLRDFFEDDYRVSPQPANYLAYSHNADSYTFGVGAYGRLNDFYGSVNRLPEAWMETYRREIFDTGLYYQGETRGGWLQREFADFSDVDPSLAAADAYDTVRVDTHHMVYLPKKFFRFLQVVPRAGFRATYYGDTLRNETAVLPATTTIETNDLGQAVTVLHPEETVTVQSPDGSGIRFCPELGMEVSFQAFGWYEDAAGKPWRHVVEPYLNYTFIPEPSLVPGELLQFDSVDRLDLTHRLKLGNRHLLQTKGADGRVTTPLDIDLYGIFDIDGPGENPETGLRSIATDGRLRPARWLRVDFDALYDADESEVAVADGRLWLLDTPLWNAYGEVNYRVDRSTLYTGGIVFSMSDAWSVNAYSRFEAEESEVEEIGGYIQYQTDCLIFRLKGRYLPGYTRSDGHEEEDDYRISLNVWLRAFPPDDIEAPTPWN
jgi:hypothetical protein